MHDLKSKTLHGLWWSAIDLGGLTGIQFVIGIVLARLLLPEQLYPSENKV